MTEWTVERLDALPEGTVIETTYGGKQLLSARVADGMTSGMWVDLEERGDCVSSRRVWVDADDGSIRVVSVPVDALLSDEAILAAAKAAEESQGWPWYGLATHHQQVALAAAAVAVRAAIAHITGEES